MLTESEGRLSLEQRVSTLECRVLGQDQRIAGLTSVIEDWQESRWGRARLVEPVDDGQEAVAEAALQAGDDWQSDPQPANEPFVAPNHSWRPGSTFRNAAAEPEPFATLVSGLGEQTEPLWAPEQPDEGESIVEALRAWTGAREAAGVVPLREVIAEDLEALDSDLPPSLPLPALEAPRPRRRLWRPQFRRHSEPDGVQDRLGRLRADLGLE